MQCFFISHHHRTENYRNYNKGFGYCSYPGGNAVFKDTWRISHLGTEPKQPFHGALNCLKPERTRYRQVFSFCLPLGLGREIKHAGSPPSLGRWPPQLQSWAITLLLPESWITRDTLSWTAPTLNWVGSLFILFVVAELLSQEETEDSQEIKY